MSLLKLHTLVTSIAIAQSFPVSQQHQVSRPAFVSNTRCNDIVRRQRLTLFSTVEKSSTEQSTSTSEEPEKYVVARGDGTTGGGGVPMKKKSATTQQPLATEQDAKEEEEDDPENPFDQLMNRGNYLRQLRLLALADEQERLRQQQKQAAASRQSAVANFCEEKKEDDDTLFQEEEEEEEDERIFIKGGQSKLPDIQLCPSERHQQRRQQQKSRRNLAPTQRRPHGQLVRLDVPSHWQSTISRAGRSQFGQLLRRRHGPGAAGRGG
mmetsp:Transcript_6236/g.13717  ORF Transcript_6236/g.13717 Transcript_6236/m.13717 type:complete len:266 (+) Transcript_6236:317-1114(+)